MADGSLFHTAGTNFTSAGGGVDPRTGLYSVSVPLGALTGNNGLGPVLPLTLTWSPLANVDAGFGRGAALAGITVFDSRQRLLTLSTGDAYRVNETSQVNLLQKKLDTVRIEKKAGSYRLAYKSGRVEVLNGPGVPVRVPQRIVSPAGHALHLTWTYLGAQPRLTQATDDTGTVLLHAEYSSGRAVLHVLPGRAEGYDVTVLQSNGLLRSIIRSDLPAGHNAWTFETQNVGPWGVWLSGTVTPGGAKTSVTYQTAGHDYPAGSPLPPLPYVTAQRVSAGPGGDALTETTYAYTAANFLGGHMGVNWNAQADPLLQGTLTAATYGSTATCGNSAVTRTYNSYHLLIKESAACGGKVTAAETAYYALQGQSFASQPAQYQQPKTHTVTLSENGAVLSRQVTTTVYDGFGNLVSRGAPDGGGVTYEYFPAGGAGEDCPAEPNGFTRLVKTVTHTPALSDYGGDQPAKTVKRLRYVSCPHAGRDVTGLVVHKDARIYVDDVLVAARAPVYDAGGGATAGRLTGRTVTHYPAGEAGASFNTVTAYSYTLSGDEQTRATTVIAHDGLSRSTARTASRLTGRLHGATDVLGNSLSQDWDGAGRPQKRTLQPGTAYASVTLWDYGAAPAEGGALAVTVTDALGNGVRTHHDGLGRTVATEMHGADMAADVWHALGTQTRDGYGRLHTQTAYDAVTTNGEDGHPHTTAWQSSQSYAYDDWGQLSSMTDSTGVRRVQVTDPATLTVATHAEGGGLRTGVSAVRYAAPASVGAQNNPGRRVSHERYAAGTASLTAAQAYSVTVQEHDGWGRLRRVTDALGQQTAFAYDRFGRPTVTTLPDGSQVSRGYADDSPAARAVSISVQDRAGKTATTGTRAFDGLGRLTQSVTGGRKTTYHYVHDADDVPETVTGPDGVVRTYTYDRALGNAPASLAAGTGDGAVSQAWAYNPVTAAMTSATEGASRTGMAYYPSGRARQTTSSPDGLPVRTSAVTWTVGGSVHSTTDYAGATQTLVRDAYGRVTGWSGGGLSVTLSRDGLGRVTGRTVTGPGGHTTGLTVTLDDFGRETQRVMTDSRGETVTVSQTWDKGDHLLTRSTVRGSTTVRSERYAYDARNRLWKYGANGPETPADETGNRLLSQTFSYDTLNNMTQILAEYAASGAGRSRKTTLTYANASDPCQLTRRVCEGGLPVDETYTYDAAGRLSEITRAGADAVCWAYDGLGRLRSVGGAPGGEYRYDGLNRLATQTAAGRTRGHWYAGGRVNVVASGEDETRVVRSGGEVIAWDRKGTDVGTWLTATDEKGSVVTADDGGTARAYAWTAYGEGASETKAAPVTGYNGEVPDAVTGGYLLGGYRTYLPSLMRFTSPDGLSPFGAGGINPYAYCGGDPVNRSDPTGHSFWRWVKGAVHTGLSWVDTATQWVGKAMNTVLSYTPGGMLQKWLFSLLPQKWNPLYWVGYGIGHANHWIAQTLGVDDSDVRGVEDIGLLALTVGTGGGAAAVDGTVADAVATGAEEAADTSLTGEATSGGTMNGQAESLPVKMEAPGEEAPVRKPIDIKHTTYQAPVDDNAVYTLRRSPSDRHLLENTQGTVKYPEGQYRFVIRTDRDVIEAIDSAAGGGHSSLTRIGTGDEITDFQPVWYAGELEYEQPGVLSRWSNGSGHYEPDEDLSFSNLSAEQRTLLPQAKFTSEVVRYLELAPGLYPSP